MSFVERADLKIGRIVEVNGTNIRVEIDSTIVELSRAVDGRVYAIGQLASIVKIHYGRRILFAYVRMLRMRSEIALEQGGAAVDPRDDSRILEADLFAQGLWIASESRLEFSRGIETYPLPLQSVYLTAASELEALYSSAETQEEQSGVSPLVRIGEYVGGNGAECRANIDKMFGQHCAILGSTGSGKSGTVAAVIHSILEHKKSDGQPLRPRIVIIDPHGEYMSAFGNAAESFKAYNAATGGQESKELRLPYWLMSGDELRSLIIGKTADEATSQNNIVYKALKYARMVGAGIVQRLAVDCVGDAEPTLSQGKTAADIARFDRDKPMRFSLDDFRHHIDVCQGRKTGKTDRLSNTERKSHDSILDKLSVLQTDPRIRFLMTDEAELNLPKVLAQFTLPSSEGATVKIVDTSGAPNEVAGPLAAVICRLLFAYKVWQTRDERDADPILVVCEEAHRYVPDRGEAQYKDAQDAVRRIAKEGRKYGLGLMLVSQRPADLESTVLSQCNSWLVLRLSNGADQDHVSRFLPDSLTGLTRILSSLARREAIFVGEAAALPARIRIRKLAKDQRPSSADISFAKGWSVDPLAEQKIKAITDRWTDPAA